MGLKLLGGQPCCSRAASSLPLPSTSAQQLTPHRRSYNKQLRQRRFNVSAFLVNPTANSSSSSRAKESISNRLSELRSRSKDEDRAFLNERSDRAAEEGGDEFVSDDAAGSHGRSVMGPWPATSSEEGSGGDGPGPSMALAGAAAGAAVTPRSFRYLMADPKPEIKLLHRFKPGQSPAETEFWRSFLDKCRLAWGVFFPPASHRRSSGLARWAGGIGRMLSAVPAGGGALTAGGGAAGGGLNAKQVVLSRLQMVLIADRCGVSPEQLLEMKAQTLTALADYMGKDLDDDVAQLEVQVSALKPNGDRITMTIGFADMLGEEEIRDPLAYHYEYEDDDDYFLPEEDTGRVADIAEAPAAGMQAARVAAAPVGATRPGGEQQ